LKKHGEIINDLLAETRGFWKPARKRTTQEIGIDLQKLKLDIMEQKKKLDQMVENDGRLKLVAIHERKRAREAAEKAEAERAFATMLERDRHRCRR
jgi:regulator of replication initiation timing